MIKQIVLPKLQWKKILIGYLLVLPVVYVFYLFYLSTEWELAFNLLLEQEPTLAFGLIHHLVMTILGYLLSQSNDENDSLTNWCVILLIFLQQFISLNYLGIALSGLCLFSIGTPDFGANKISELFSKNNCLALVCLSLSLLVIFLQKLN